MCLYPPPLLIGVAFGVFAPMGGARRLVVGCSAACALCLLVMQTAVGFPVEAGMRRGVAQSFAEEAARVRGEPPPPAADAAAAGFVAVYTPWLWLSFAGDGAALFAVALEWGAWRRWPTPAVPRRRDRTLGAAVGLTLLLAVLAGGAWAALSWKGARAPGAALKPRFAQPPPPDEQRATWRKTAAQYRGGYVVAVRSPGLDTWLMYGEEDGQWAVDSRLPRSILRNRGTAVVNEPFKLTLKDAKDMAKWGAGGRSTAAAAVLDVWSKDAPFVVCWYYDDGSGAREFKDSPTPELGRRMDDFLQDPRPTPRGTDRGARPVLVYGRLAYAPGRSTGEQRHIRRVANGVGAERGAEAADLVEGGAGKESGVDSTDSRPFSRAGGWARLGCFCRRFQSPSASGGCQPSVPTKTSTFLSSPRAKAQTVCHSGFVRVACSS